MKIIPISGVIANFEYDEESNVTPSSLRKSLNDAGSEDILVTINSPGGSVFAGLEMFSLLQNYPGNVETRIISFAASMGSVLALAGNKKSAENTAMFFIHNAIGVGIGDYRELAKESKFLEDVSKLIANLYAEYTLLDLKDARNFMDEDSQFFGNDLELLGFEIIQTDQSLDESSARVNAKMKFSEARAKMMDEKYSDNLEKAVASIDFQKFGIKNKPDVPDMSGDEFKNNSHHHNIQSSGTKPETTTGNTPAPIAGNNIQEVNAMTLTEYLASNPTAQIEYNAALTKNGTEQFEAGVKSVQDRIAGVLPFVNSDSKYPAAIKSLGFNVIDGKCDISSLKAAIATFDAMNEKSASDDAIDETGEQGDAKGQQSQTTSTDGNINNEVDLSAAINKAKSAKGMEVK